MSEDTRQALRMEQLRQTAPEAYNLVRQLSLKDQKRLALAFPTGGSMFVGIEADGRVMKPADPIAFHICHELTRLVWEESLVRFGPAVPRASLGPRAPKARAR